MFQPRQANRQRVSSQVTARGRSGNPPLALIVDDESAICSTLADVLEDEDFLTISASSGPEALRLAEERQPDLVFLDIWMAGWDGLETLVKIREISPLSQVIMISGHANISSVLEASRRGAFDFIEKPLDLESIIFSARRALERREQLAELTHTTGEPSSGSELPEREDLPLLTYPALLSDALSGKNVGQRTLARSIILYGQGLHSGQKSGLVLEPLPLNSGIHFVNIGKSKVIPAFIDYVESTDFATTLRYGGTVAATIEHLLATLHAYRISNVLIKCNGEVPIFDGSAREFCERIAEVGLEEQGGVWHELAVDCPIRAVCGPKGVVSQSETESITIEPSENFSISYELFYPLPIGRQVFEFTLDSPESFQKEIAPARTFGFMKDIEKLQKAGLAAGGRLDNFVLIGPEQVLNTELRFPDEPVRHKILDIIGDLYLLGRPIRGRVRARMTGHSDNIRLLSKIRDLIFVGSEREAAN